MTLAVNPEVGIAQLSGARVGVLKQIVQLCGKPHIEILEVGSYEGISALHWSTFIANHCDSGAVHCIDPWQPYLEKSSIGNATASGMDTELAAGTVFERFKRNILLAPPKAPITWFRGTLKEYVPEHQFDIVFIDGNHTLEAVLCDLTIANKLLKVGGILCGDDLEKVIGNDLTIEHARELCESGNEYVAGFHPGVTVALHDFFGFDVVGGAHGVWAVRKEAVGWSKPDVHP